MEKKQIEEVFEKLCQEIGGEWLILGGGFVQIAYQTGRTTEDLDLAFVKTQGPSKEALLNSLYQWSQKKMGLGPELLNPSAEFFLNQIQGWENEIISFQSGPKGQIYRPTLTLFCALKMKRASEIDLKDIESALKSEGVKNLNMNLLQQWLTEEQLQKFMKNFLTP